MPRWDTVPSTDSTYSIWESEVQLFDSGGTNYVRCGVYLPELPTSSATDSSITITSAASTSDPLVSNYLGVTADDFKVATGSPAIGAADQTYMPTVDYFDTTRASGDMGFYEFVVSGGASGGRLMIGW